MRVASLTIALITLFSVLLVGVRAVGAAIPYANSLEALGFSVCDERPCYLGIKPGITTWNDVLQAVPEYSGNEWEVALRAGKAVRNGDRCSTASTAWISLLLDTRANANGDPLSNTLDTSLNCKADRVMTINTMPHRNYTWFSSLDQLIAIYGAPCAFYLHEPPGFPSTLFLEYPEMMVRVTVVPDEPTNKFPLEQIVMGQDTNAYIVNNCDQEADVYSRWHGFASIDYYRVMQTYDIQLRRNANQ